jgi:hypothetical protein
VLAHAVCPGGLPDVAGAFASGAGTDNQLKWSAMAEPLLSTDFHVGKADVDTAMVLFYATPLRGAEPVLAKWRREIGTCPPTSSPFAIAPPPIHEASVR